jgi:hypothetical protein
LVAATDRQGEGRGVIGLVGEAATRYATIGKQES